MKSSTAPEMCAYTNKMSKIEKKQN